MLTTCHLAPTRLLTKLEPVTPMLDEVIAVPIRLFIQLRLDKSFGITFLL